MVGHGQMSHHMCLHFWPHCCFMGQALCTLSGQMALCTGVSWFVIGFGAHATISESCWTPHSTSGHWGAVHVVAVGRGLMTTVGVVDYQSCQTVWILSPYIFTLTSSIKLFDFPQLEI